MLRRLHGIGQSFGINFPKVATPTAATYHFHCNRMPIDTLTMRPNINFTLNPEEIISLTKSTLGKCVGELDRVGSLSTAECTFEKVILPVAFTETAVRTELSAVNFLQHVSINEQVRNASVEANKLIDQYYIEKGMREDLFKATRAVAENEAIMNGLDSESKRLIKKMMLAFKHNGMFLDEEKRALLKEKRKRLAELEVDFSKNLGDDKSVLLLSAEELEGCPKDFIEGLQQSEDGKYILTMKYPDVFGVLKNAKREDVRKRMDIAFNSRSHINGPLLEEAIQLRFDCAKLLGYTCHAELQLEENLAKNPQSVNEFEKDLHDRLTVLAKRELKKLKVLKASETSSEQALPEFYSFDYHYYSRILLEKEYSVDEEKIKEYFSFDMVMREMLNIYEEVLGLRFTEITDGPTWHSDVLLYKVTNQQNDSMVGYVYLDLFPRDGKYTHAACFDLIPGCSLPDGSRQYPVAAMVANFSKPTATRPSLLKHDEVITLFHELGHAMHDMCALTRYSRFHGTSVETDFVEAPSQMLENWCWDPTILKRLSKHYLNPSESLPHDLINQLVKVKKFNAGLLNLRQVFFGLFDMAIHSIKVPFKETDISKETIDSFYGRLRHEITLIPQPDGVSPASSFGHMMGGYDAGYYGYLWSQVFSADMFYSRFLSEGLQNSKVGLDYRLKVLGPGGSRDGMESLIDFLGRPPNNKAFLRSLGIEDAESVESEMKVEGDYVVIEEKADL